MNKDEIIAFQNDTLDRQSEFIESQQLRLSESEQLNCELLKQRNILLNALQMAINFIDMEIIDWDMTYGQKTKSWIPVARAALKKSSKLPVVKKRSTK